MSEAELVVEKAEPRIPCQVCNVGELLPERRGRNSKGCRQIGWVVMLIGWPVAFATTAIAILNVVALLESSPNAGEGIPMGAVPVVVLAQLGFFFGAAFSWLVVGAGSFLAQRESGLACTECGAWVGVA